MAGYVMMVWWSSSYYGHPREKPRKKTRSELKLWQNSKSL